MSCMKIVPMMIELLISKITWVILRNINTKKMFTKKSKIILIKSQEKMIMISGRNISILEKIIMIMLKKQKTV